MDTYEAVETACRESLLVDLSLVDGRKFKHIDLCLNNHHPGKDFGICGEEVIGLDYAEVAEIRLINPLSGAAWAQLEPMHSVDGKPFHNGYCWQNSGDEVVELGRCPGCQKYWGASTKSIRCDCGEFVSLT